MSGLLNVWPVMVASSILSIIYSSTGSRTAIHRDAWCGRCQWLFVSQSATYDHIRDSQRHWGMPYLRGRLFDGNGTQIPLEKLLPVTAALTAKCPSTFNSAGSREHPLRNHRHGNTCVRDFQNSDNLIQVGSIPSVLKQGCQMPQLALLITMRGHKMLINVHFRLIKTVLSSI